MYSGTLPWYLLYIYDTVLLDTELIALQELQLLIRFCGLQIPHATTNEEVSGGGCEWQTKQESAEKIIKG